MYFLGYSPTQKGYKCYSPNTQRFYVSADVKFMENTPFYTKTEFQGGSESEFRVWESDHLLSLSPTTTQPLQSDHLSLSPTKCLQSDPYTVLDYDETSPIISQSPRSPSQSKSPSSSQPPRSPNTSKTSSSDQSISISPESNNQSIKHH